MSWVFTIVLPAMLLWFAVTINRINPKHVIAPRSIHWLKAIKLCAITIGLSYFLTIVIWYTASSIHGYQTNTLDGSLANGFGATFAATMGALFSFPLVLILLTAFYAAAQSIVKPKK